ncbi:MAG TPA: multicopper oxidase domain-containing protein [Armatimonadota bacterium]|nr:multicopper oxidase domain-containing protein [Armatimonadota bacterium]
MERRDRKGFALRLEAILLYLAAVAVVLACAATSSFAQQVPLNSATLTKYLDPLPDPAVLMPDATTYPGYDYYEIAMTEFSQKLHTQLPPTIVWGYSGSYPGPTIESQRGTPTKVKWVNGLVDPILQFFLPVDQTLHWANPLGLPMDDPLRFLPYMGPVPTVTHLHGGEVRSDSDGHPEDWFLPGQWKIYDYPNAQEATTLWYHDHALGATRLNVYGGLAAFYLLRDSSNEPANLPSGDYEREIVIQDRMFDINGQLLFPSAGINPMVHPFWIPEFFGDTIVVNGKIWPYLNVEPRRYRFRLLNGSNARFYNLSFGNRMPFWQIGTDGGLVDKPVMVSPLLLALGERADVIVDFGGIPTGTNILLTNDARYALP